MAKGGAKGKYRPEVVDVIITAIEETGREIDGYKAAGISHQTFNRWKNEKNEFRDQVQKAHAKFRKYLPETLRKKALESVADYLHNGHQETCETKEIIQDANGNVIQRKTTLKTFKRPVPYWVVDRVLGKNLPLIEAVQILMQNGVATPQQAAIVEECLSDMERKLREISSLEQQQNQLEATYQQDGPPAGSEGP